MVKLGRVIITVDALTGLESIKRFDECQQQIALADVLLITKSDIDASNVTDLKNKLKRINPEASVYTSNSGRTEVDLFSLTGRDTYKAVSNMSHQTHHHHHAHSDLHSISLRRTKPMKAVTLTLKVLGNLCFLRSSVKDIFLTIWTTTPWTLPSNTALAGVKEEATVGTRTTLDVLDAEQETLQEEIELIIVKTKQ